VASVHVVVIKAVDVAESRRAERAKAAKHNAECGPGQDAEHEQ
jgi:hypothetical protein